MTKLRKIKELSLDPTRFEEVTLGDATLQLRLFTAFLADLPGMRSSVEAGPGPKWRDVLHALEATCHVLAAPRLLAAVRASRGERANPHHLREELDRAEDAVRAAVWRLQEARPASGRAAQCVSSPR